MKKTQKYIVSAVVPVYNGESFIGETIKSLLGQTRKFDEIVVADDGSTDRTVEIVKKFKQVRLVQSNHVERIAIRNIGWKAAKGNIIAFIDSDLVLVPEWLEEILKGFDKGYAAAVDRRAVHHPQTYIAKLNDHFFDIRYGDNYKPFTLWVIRRDLLEQLGGLDEQVIAFEDIDIADRVFESGHDVFFAAKAIAYHKGEPVSIREEIRRNFWFGSHVWPYWKKRIIGRRFVLSQDFLTSFRKPFRCTLFFVMTLLLLVKPIVLILFTLFCYLYVIVRDIKRGMKMNYIFVHAYIAVISEYTYAYGVLYGLFFGPITFARKRAAVQAAAST